jgi:zinc transport system ATP-binding protein
MKSPAFSANLPAIEVNGLTVDLAGHRILTDVSFTVPQGAIAACIGPNGSGKTTLLRAILGLVPASAGEARILGSRLEHVRTVVGYVPQRFDFDRTFPMTVREFMALALHDHAPSATILAKIEEVGLAEAVLERQLGQLSGGQLQRVLIAQAIINDPLILFMDEPSAGVDIAGEATFYDLLRHLNRKHHTTVIMVSHDVAVLSELVDQVICISGRLLCSGAPQAVLSDKTIAEVFGSGAAGYLHRHRHNEDHDHTDHLA